MNLLNGGMVRNFIMVGPMSNKITKKIIMFTEDFKTVIDEISIPVEEKNLDSHLIPRTKIIFEISEKGFIYVVYPYSRKMKVLFA